MSAPDHPFNSPASPDSVSDDSSKIVETAKADLAGLGEEVSQQAAAIGAEAQAQVGELAQKAKGIASEQKDLLVEQIGGVSDALQRVAGELEGDGQSSAQYVRLVADGANRLTSTLRDNDVEHIFDIVQDFGRRQPVAFLGAAALLGFAASRFVTASAARQGSTTQPNHAVVTTPNGGYHDPLAPDYAASAGGEDAGI